MKIKLYDNANIEELSNIHPFLIPLIKNSPKNYIDNANTQMFALEIDNVVLPITVNNNDHHNNSLVCSPYNHYITYAYEELKDLNNVAARKVSMKCVDALGALLNRGKVDKMVMVNNWLLSTNLYPNLTQNHIQRIKTFLIERFPEHTLIFRSINHFQTGEIATALLNEGFGFVPGRIVYYTNPESTETYKSRMFKSDYKIFQNSPYKLIGNSEITSEDIPRIISLYRALNIEKHSKVNPQFNEQYLELAIRSNFFEVKAFKLNGRIDAVLAYVSNDKCMTSPIFGYDTSLPQELGLYRLLSTLLLLQAKENKLFLNQSAGGGSFKKLRRAENGVEYNAVYCKHLPLTRRIPWNLLRFSLNTIGIPIMKKLS